MRQKAVTVNCDGPVKTFGHELQNQVHCVKPKQALDCGIKVLLHEIFETVSINHYRDLYVYLHGPQTSNTPLCLKNIFLVIKWFPQRL